MAFRIPLDTYRITQGFGGNAEYYKQFGQKGHNGIDLGAPAGTPVYAADEGTVVFEGYGKSGASGYAGWFGNPGGICILINHIGSFGGYAHLSETIVNANQKVAKGQLIGYVGATGAATGPHLHFEMLPLNPNFNNGFAGRIDPTPYIVTTTNATDAQIRQAYLDILEREADAAGIAHYRNYPADFVRQDLAASNEKRELDRRKAEAALAEASRQAEEARKAAERQAAEEAARQAQEELDRIAAEEEAARLAAEEKSNQYADIIAENNTLLKQILSIVQTILNKLTSVFK